MSTMLTIAPLLITVLNVQVQMNLILLHSSRRSVRHNKISEEFFYFYVISQFLKLSTNTYQRRRFSVRYFRVITQSLLVSTRITVTLFSDPCLEQSHSLAHLTAWGLTLLTGPLTGGKICLTYPVARMGRGRYFVDPSENILIQTADSLASSSVP